MRKIVIAMLACAGVFALSAPDAVAEKVRGTETCTNQPTDRTINGKKYTCATKCTTPVTDTTCQGGACQTTVYNEVTYKDCEEKAAMGGKVLQQMTIEPGVLTLDPGPTKKPKFQDQLKRGSGVLLQQ